jgi:plasmid segregation protein ParM
VFRSLIGPAIEIKYHNDLISNGHGLAIQVEGKRWFVGDLARLQSPFTVSPRARDRDPEIIRVLMLAALHEIGASGEVKLVTGLPVSWYGDREKLARSLRGPHVHSVNGEEHQVTISEVLVIPQPFGSFFRMLLSGTGRLPDESIPLTRQRVAVIDVGTHTTDYALADALRYVEPKSSSIEVAMGRVYELVQRAVGEQIREIDFQEAEEAVQTGEVLMRGRPHDVSSFVDEAVAQVGAQIVGQARTLWGTGDDLASVLLTGGGAEIFLATVRAAYPHAHIMPEPQMANADGFYRYGIRKFE